jgi:hypothetical protein
VTVCIAALAASGGCIVCVADKALSYADVAWDSDVDKIIRIGTRRSACALTSGADKYLTRFLRKIDDFAGYNGPLNETINYLEDKYKECITEMQQIEILTPNAITREEYIGALASETQSPIIQAIREQLEKFRKEFDCELLVCGFAQQTQPYLLWLYPPGNVTDCTNNGIAAVGGGAEKAMSRLLFVEHKKSNGVAHVLYDCFDAKANAEMSAFVGYEWDACLISESRVKELDAEAKPLLDRVWAKRNRSPFKKKRELGEMKGPPRDWEMRLRKLVAKSFGSAFNESGEWQKY